MGSFFYSPDSKNSENSETKEKTSITTRKVKKPRCKEIQKISYYKDEEGDMKEVEFKSYMHNFHNYMKIIVAIHHLQKIEAMHNEYPSLSFFFYFERMEDFELFSEVAKIFEAKADLLDDKKSDDNMFICHIHTSPKLTKTYLFANYIYDEIWLKDKIPKMLDREVKEGMDYIRFITLKDNTRDMLVKELKSQKDVLSCEQKDFFILLNKTYEFKLPIYTITAKI
jgi:hypothetical protein